MLLGRRHIASIALLVMVFLIYGNTFNSSWHLDDVQNILTNDRLHIDHLSIGSLWQAAYAHPMHPGSLYRPVACISLAINWYFGKDNVFGYHLVNISIHMLTALLLYLLILDLFQTPKVKTRYPAGGRDIALLASLLWAINPIQTQAVTYIVQRMASMAAMFYVLAMLFYIRARLNGIKRKKVAFLMGSLFCFVLAVGAKENALILPFSLILLETIFFQSLKQYRKILMYGSVVLCIATVIVFGSYLLIRQNDLLSFLNGYDNRPFTLGQRLLSEPRIIVLYLSQIFFPSSNNLSITHDFNISTSLFNPGTTFPAILFVIITICFGFYKVNKSPFLSFAILFFFLNHLIESSIIPLELIFEHRNYLPSLFLFVPIAIGFKKIIDRYSRKSSFMPVFIFVTAVLIIISIGLSTRTRNAAWATEKTLWEDAMRKAPDSARPLQNLACIYYEKTGAPDKSFQLLKTALKKRGDQKNYKASLYYNLALICFKEGRFNKSIEFYKRGIRITPKDSKFYYHMSQSYMMIGRWKDALKTIDMPLSHSIEKVDYLYLKGLILLKMGRPSDAIPLFRKVIKMGKNDNNKSLLGWSGLGAAMNMLGKPFVAERFFKKACSMAPKNRSIILGLIEAKVRQKNMLGAKRYADTLLSLEESSGNVYFVKRANENLHIPLNWELINQIIAKKLEEKDQRPRLLQLNLLRGSISK